MKINVKGSLLAAALGFGAITAASAAQQPAQTTQRPITPMGNQMPMGQAPMMSGERPMMHNPEMRAQMSEMMRGCNRMMQRMGSMRDQRQ
jgi:hypothetical protein